jgi:DNA polymerase-3 subunit alpha|tara:strand:+ start:2507 stop:6025 length:3519 start_codon:yes stop_codon:yes gene_type:complete
MNIKLITPPTKFVGFHGHTGFSVFDGLGYPSNHIDFVLENGMDAWALTDHGNGSGLAHAHKHAEKVKKQGHKFRQIYGCEFYFVPSLKDWKGDYEQAKLDRAAAKQKAIKDDGEGGHVIENEDETKTFDLGKDEWKRRYHLVITAQNREGLGNLFTLIKRGYTEGFYRYPRIDFDMLKKYGKGLTVSTACLGGIFSNRIMRGNALKIPEEQIQQQLLYLSDRFVDAVGEDNFYLELQFNRLKQQHLVNHHLLRHADQTGLQLIATPDSHYYSPDKWEARELYKKLGWMGSDPSPLPEFDDLKCELYPKNAQQMWSEFTRHYDEYKDTYEGYEEKIKRSIEITHEIAWEKCEDCWIDTSVKLPDFNKPNETAFQQLAKKVKTALVTEGLHTEPEYVKRAKHELDDIKFLGFENYFLVMYEVFHKAADHTLFGAARGSGGGSLVNFLLGITQVDPLKYDLLWERFLGRHRTSWPDIDSDAGDRDALIDAARELYGDQAVIPVSNFNTLKLKSLVKDIAKFYGIDFAEVNKMTGPLQDEVMMQARDDNTEKSVFVLKHSDCMQYSTGYSEFMERHPKVKDHIESLFMQNRSIGRHAGGVIIGPPEALEQSMPIIGVRGELQTPWTEGMNFRNLEDNGFIKFDFLGLTLLKDVENCIRRVLTRETGVEPTFLEIRDWFDEKLNCRFVEQDDEEVWKHVYHQRRKVGVFQFTAEGARRFCEEAKPTTIIELAALTAIYRPGPLRANVHKKYVKDKLRADEIHYAHPIIKEILGPTFGHVTFQEQFMLLAQKLGGFTPAESDKLRKTLVKKSLDTMGNKGGERDEARTRFVKGAKEINGVPEHISQELWERIEFFSVYGFNKSHAVAYAIGSYYAAWLHTHYETDWLGTILESENNNPNALTKAIAEIKEMGYRIELPDVNESGTYWQWSENKQAFIPPLTSIKGVGKTAVVEIMQNRPYESVVDMLFDETGKWRHSKLNKTGFSSLCKVEAFNGLKEMWDGTIDNHKQLYEIIIDNYNNLKKSKWGMTMRKAKKENAPDMLPILIEQTKDTEDWGRIDKLTMYQELCSATRDDLAFPDDMMEKIKSANVKSVLSMLPREKCIAWCCIVDMVKKKTKNNKTFYRLKITDYKNNTGWLRMWGNKPSSMVPYSIWLVQASNDPNWGASTSVAKVRPLVTD